MKKSFRHELKGLLFFPTFIFGALIDEAKGKHPQTTGIMRKCENNLVETGNLLSNVESINDINNELKTEIRNKLQLPSTILKEIQKHTVDEYIVSQKEKCLVKINTFLQAIDGNIDLLISE